MLKYQALTALLAEVSFLHLNQNAATKYITGTKHVQSCLCEIYGMPYTLERTKPFKADVGIHCLVTKESHYCFIL